MYVCLYKIESSGPEKCIKINYKLAYVFISLPHISLLIIMILCFLSLLYFLQLNWLRFTLAIKSLKLQNIEENKKTQYHYHEKRYMREENKYVRLFTIYFYAFCGPGIFNFIETHTHKHIQCRILSSALHFSTSSRS